MVTNETHIKDLLKALEDCNAKIAKMDEHIHRNPPGSETPVRDYLDVDLWIAKIILKPALEKALICGKLEHF